MSKDPRGLLFHCAFQLYGGKRSGKTRRKVPNLNAVEVVVCFFFNASTIVQNLFILKFILLVENPFSSAVC